jgi:hypothetical protein
MTIMSEAVADDETAAGLGPDAETEFVEPVDYPETPAAWSLVDTELAEVPHPRSWREAWTVAGVVAAAAVVAVVAVSVVALVGHHPSPAAVPPSTMPASALPPIQGAPIVPPHVAAAPEDDGWVATAVSQRAISTHHGDALLGGSFKAPTQRGAVAGALRACANYTGNNDCQLLNNGVYHGCIAYSVDWSTASFTVGTGPNERAAAQASVNALGIPNPPGDSNCSDHAGEH